MLQHLILQLDKVQGPEESGLAPNRAVQGGMGRPGVQELLQQKQLTVRRVEMLPCFPGPTSTTTYRFQADGRRTTSPFLSYSASSQTPN